MNTMSHVGSGIKRNVVVGIVAVIGGYLGSLLHDMTISKPTTIRAERFEVVARSGRLLSYWGPDADRNVQGNTPRGTLLVFLDSNAVRRFQLGARGGDYSPQLLLYDQDGPLDTPERYGAQPRVSVGLGWTGSPTLNMRGRDGDSMALGARYGDVSGTRELGWGLSFRGWSKPAIAEIGYTRWSDDIYQAGIGVTDGSGRRWGVSTGQLPKPKPILAAGSPKFR